MIFIILFLISIHTLQVFRGTTTKKKIKKLKCFLAHPIVHIKRTEKTIA